MSDDVRMNIRAGTLEDEAQILALRLAIYHDRPRTTLAEWLERIAATPARAERETAVAERDGQIVGWASLSRALYHDDQGTHRCQIQVASEHRRRGIGNALWGWLRDRSESRGVTHLYTRTREDVPEGIAFAERRGFRRTGHGDRISRLDVARANVDACERASRRLAEFVIRIATMAEMGMEEQTLRAVHELESETAQDVPHAGTWHDIPFDEWVHLVFHSPGTSPETFWVALDGDRPVGFATLVREGEDATNAYTGVHRAYRSRGTARALKYHTVAYARRHGIPFLHTGNDPTNAPMLAINLDLGYQMLPRDIELVRDQS